MTLCIRPTHIKSVSSYSVFFLLRFRNWIIFPQKSLWKNRWFWSCKRAHQWDCGTVRPIVVGLIARSIFAGSQAFCSKKKKKTVVRAGGAAGEREGETKWKQVAGRESPFELQQSLSPAHRIFDRRNLWTSRYNYAVFIWLALWRERCIIRLFSIFAWDRYPVAFHFDIISLLVISPLNWRWQLIKIFNVFTLSFYVFSFIHEYRVLCGKLTRLDTVGPYSLHWYRVFKCKEYIKVSLLTLQASRFLWKFFPTNIDLIMI